MQPNWPCDLFAHAATSAPLPFRLDTTRTKASMSGTCPHLLAVPPSAFGADRGVPHVEGAEGVEVDIDPMAHNWPARGCIHRCHLTKVNLPSGPDRTSQRTADGP